jgi:hypothetical protein
VDGCWLGSLNPQVVNHDRGVAHAGNQVDKKVIAVRLEKPDGVASLASETFLLQDLDRLDRTLRGQKNVKVFGVAVNSGVFLKSKGAGNRVSYMPLLEQGEDLTEKKPLLPREPEGFRRRF